MKHRGNGPWSWATLFGAGRKARVPTASLRVEVKETLKRKRSVRFYIKLIMALLLLGGSCASIYYSLHWLSDKMCYENPKYVLEEIRVEVVGRIRKDQVLKWASVPKGINLMKVDLLAVQKRIQDQPCVEGVVVRRELPNRLSIEVKERVPLARVVTDKDSKEPSPGIFTVDREGMIMRPRSGEKVSHLPEIRGAPWEMIVPGNKVASDANEIFSALNLLSQIEMSPVKVEFSLLSVDVSKENVLRLATRGGGYICFSGDSTRHKEQMDRLRQIYFQAGRLKKDVMTVDLTVARNVPVTFVPDPS